MTRGSHHGEVIHPHDIAALRRCHLLGFVRQGSIYVDGMLQFGLRSAPKIFTAVADALEWIVSCWGVAVIDHYLDDFVVMGPRGSPECARALDTI